MIDMSFYPTLGCDIQGFRAMGFSVQYWPRWFQDFPAIWLAVPFGANRAHLWICTVPEKNLICVWNKLFLSEITFSQRRTRPMKSVRGEDKNPSTFGLGIFAATLNLVVSSLRNNDRPCRFAIKDNGKTARISIVNIFVCVCYCIYLLAGYVCHCGFILNTALSRNRPQSSYTCFQWSYTKTFRQMDNLMI